ncbi:MAG TPA: amino acid adenylation domain-containing protein [Blastocatellia bacterium]|nr:amino acid adenylation domain-containing protein [Blastocatellia bacterium]
MIMVPENEIIEGFRLTPQQSRLWTMPPAPEAYRAQAVWTLNGALDASRLQRALHEVVKRHEILRTTFASLPGVRYPVQVIGEDASFQYREILVDGMRELPEAALARRSMEEIEHASLEEAQSVFGNQHGPLLHVCLLKLAPRSHALIVTLPALCADSRSLSRLIDEVGGLYAIMGEAQTESALAGDPVQYAQFSEWQNELLADASLDGEDGRAYWRNQRYGAMQSLCLPEQNSADPLTGTAEALQVIRLGREALERLESLAGAQSATLETLLLAAWYALIWRLAGQRRITLGYHCDGRKYEELAGALGLFAKWTPATCELAEDYRFDELLRETERIISEAQRWQEYFAWEESLEGAASALAYAAGAGAVDASLARVGAEGQGGNEAGGEPAVAERFFSLGFKYETRDEPHWGVGLEVKLFRQQINTDRFYLYLTCAPAGESLDLEFHYHNRAFTAEAVARLADQYITLLRHAERAGPGITIDELELLSSAQRKQVLYDWNQTNSLFPHEKSVRLLIEEQVARTPTSTALASTAESLTYEELNRRANMLAHYLISIGVGPEKRVGILLDRSVEMFVALLGALKAGAAYVPLEVDDGSRRSRHMLSDAGLCALLTQERLAGSLPEHVGQVVCLDSQWTQLAAHPDRNPARREAPDNLMYVIYTSGSTGLPKGALITHRGVTNYLHWSAGIYAVGRPINALVHSPIAFDLTVTSVYTPWLVGGCVLLAEEGEGASALINGLRRHGAVNGLLKLTPAHLEAMRQESSHGVVGGIGEVLVIGGEALFGETVKRWRERYPELRIINEYGPTETVVGCCVYELPPDYERSGAVPIGRPIANSEMYVLDEKRRPAPIGVVGEIYIGGAGLARGYHHRPDLTAEKFVPHPFSAEGGERLYRTGDLGRYLSDGNIEYVGRIDEQVKVRGHRVEPGEIEAVLLEREGAREALVIAHAGEPEGPNAGTRGPSRLIAYVVGDEALTASEWRAYLRERLPDYMIPSAFIALDRMPLARNGKVDRRALPAPEQARAGSREPLAAPHGFIEEVLVSIWAEALQVEPIGIHDNFFDLGGDSMRSIQVCARAQRKGLNISHDQIFQYQTISRLAQEVGFAGVDRVSAARPGPFSLISEEDLKRMPDGVEDAYPLAMLQAGMVFHSEFNPDAAIFHDQHSFHLHARFDPSVMERTLREVMERHAVLRASFELSLFTQPLQLIHKSVTIPFTVEDLRHLPAEAHEQAIAAWMIDDKKQRFAWTLAPLLRFHAHRRTDESFQFTMSFHHAILDGWSAASLLTELFKRYLALLEDPASPGEAPLAASFRDFVALEQAALASEDCRQYWKKQLADVTIHRLPRLPETRPSGVVPVKVSDVIIPAEVSDGLKKLARAAGVPFKSVLLAAHMKVMSLLAGTTDVVSGLVFNGRPEETDGDRALGLFLNTLPFRLNLTGGTWRELVERTFEVERDSLPFRRYPLAELQRIGTGQPLFESSFNFMHYHIYNTVGELKDAQLLGYRGYEETNFTLTANFSLDLVSGNTHLGLNYHPTELTDQQLQVIGGYYLSTLTAMATEPQSRYGSHCALSARETQQLLIEWNQTATEYQQEGFIHQMFEARAERTPDHVAVICGPDRISYRQLNDRADRLALRLRRLGVKPEVRVAILAERSIELVVGLLGILKAGGAYVPLDPTYPAERLRAMVEDSAARVMLVGAGLKESAPAHNGELIELGGEDSESDWSEEKALVYGLRAQAELEDENVAYVIYTSGSTGRPKGVMNTHGAIRNRLLWMQEIYQLNESDRVLQKTPYSFDVSVWEFFWPLMFGAQLVMARPGGHLDSRYLAEVIREKEVTVLHFVPSMLSVFIEEEGVAECRSVRQIISSGEALSGRLARRAQERMPWAKLDNLYGPTEAAVDVTRWRCGPVSETIPIGRPIANIELYILNESGGLAPIGTPGELFIGGVGLARGYDNRADLSAEKFTPHPFSHQPGARLYRTGDLARYLADGQIEYLGRLDHQVKIRGNRIELGEIEAALLQHDEVREAVLMARESRPDGDLHVVAYFVPENGPENTNDSVAPSALREFLRSRLPEFMVPSYFVPLKTLPLTPNGKIDRRELPAPHTLEDARRAYATDYVAPQSDTEKTLAEIWANVLGVARIGTNDNFFDLGGHSLIATQVISRLRDAFHVALPLRVLFETPTVATLAAMIDRERKRSTTADPADGQLTIASQGATDIDKMLEELESLSPDEAEALLSGERYG